MKLFELIEFIDANGIRVETQQGKLNITADDSVLIDNVMDAFRTFKKELAAYYLHVPPASEAPDPARRYPLSFAQQRLYFLYQYNRDALHFNIPVELCIQGALDVDAFLSAIDEMVKQHPVYQTTYCVADGVSVQRYEPELRSGCAYIDFSALPAEELETKLAAARTQLAQTPFDLETQPPLRMQLLRTGADTYSLLLVFHHIATDEWSSMRLIEDLARAYQTKRGDAAAPRRSRMNYFDFVAWQRARFERGGYEVARSYWRDHLDGAPRVLELPLDRPRPAQQTFKYGLVSRELPAALRCSMVALAQRLEITEFALYLAVYYLLLQRLTGQRDLVVGIDVYGRDSEHFDDVAGFFVNQLALRSIVPSHTSAGRYLEQVGRMSMRGLSFQEMPFDKVVDDLQCERETAYSPVFQVKFLFHGNTLDLDQFGGLKIWTRDAFDAQSQYDATLQVLPHEIRLHYNSDLFLDSTVQGWLDTYFSLLEECLHDVDQSIDDLLKGQFRQQLAGFTQGSSKVVPHDAIFRRIARAISDAPQRPAVLTPEHSITYAELGDRIGAMARHLESIGIQPGDKVGVFLERSIDMVVAIVATMSTGAVLVPLDTSYPAERINEILTDSGVSAVITSAALTDHLGEYYGVRLDVARLHLQPSKPSQLIRSGVEASAPAYLLYTSGSTGRPKGVLVRHESFANICDWYIDFAGIDAASRVLLMIPIGFDAALKNIFAPLMSGATLVLSPPSVFDPDALLRLIDASEVTTINCAPSALYALLHADQARSYSSLRHLRMLAVGGEALQLEAVKPWLRSSQCHSWLANIYGPTECTDISVAYKADRATWLARDQVVIGRPIQNTQAFIVDEALRQCPPGAIGELVIAGRGVALGYHRQPEEATSPFVRCDLSQMTVYRSGDICRYDREGLIVYLGRRDGQVKVRGKRVETDEVLAQLARLLPGRALSVQLYARNGAEMLIAFAEGDAPSDPVSAIREELFRRLPRHAVPAQILFLPKLPLTTNGKVSGPALLELYEAERGRSADVPTRPLTETEAGIAAVWADLLRTPVTDPRADFFSLGGDSIVSIQLVAQLHKHGFAVTVADIFKYPSVEQLAELCDQLTRLEIPAPRHERLAPFALVAPADRAHLPAGLEDAYPLTPLQLGMLFHSDMERGGAVYHDVFSYDLEFEYHAVAFKEAIQRVVDAHPVLRTSFDLRSYSMPLQLVHKHVSARIAQTDISSLPGHQQDEAIRATTERLKRTAFDISASSLIRFTLFKRNERRIQFVVDAHHVILDGWSMATLKRQIFETYLHLTQGVPLSGVFESGDIGFVDYVASQARDEADAASRAFWKAYCDSCADGAITGLPLLSGDARYFEVTIDPTLVQQLDALSRREGISLKTLLLLAHMHMLRALGDDAKVMTALTDNGRPEVQGAENVAGLFLNVLPFRASFARQTWRTLAEAARADDIDRKPHRRFPFASIVRDNRALQIDSLFTYNDFHVAKALLKSDAVKLLGEEHFAYSNFKLAMLAARNLESGITLRLSTRADLSDWELQVLLREFLSALRCMVAGYDAPVPERSARPVPCFHSNLNEGGHRYSHLRYQGRFDHQALQIAATLLALRQRCQDEQWLWLGTSSAREYGSEALESLFASADASAALQVVHRDAAGWQQLAVRFCASGWKGTAVEPLAAELLGNFLAMTGDVRELELRTEMDGPWYPCEQIARDADYWAAQCRGVTARLNLPADPLPVSLAPELCSGVQELASSCGASVLAVQLSAWLILLARLSSESTVLTGASAPIAIDLADDPDVMQAVSRVATALAAAAEHPYVPMHVLDHCEPTRVVLQTEHYVNLLTAMVAGASKRVSRLEFLSQAERQQLLAWNDTRQEFAADGLIHELFERQAEQRPDVTAVEFEGERLSYAQLNARANQLARHLRNLGVGPDCRVGLCVERSLEMVIGMLATLKAGGAYVPLDPSYPPERLSLMVQDSAPVVLLIQRKLQGYIEACEGCAVVVLDHGAWERSGWSASSERNLSATDLGLRSSHLAYVIYTSGSTGTPKGVMVQHSNVLNFVHGMEQRIYQRRPPCQNIAWNSSFGFDMSVKAWGQLLMGRTVFLIPEAVRFNPRALIEFIHKHRIEAIECTPSHLQLMLDAGLISENASAIRTVLIGGEAIDPATWEALASVGDRVAFFNMYGPTEATVDAALGLVAGHQVTVGVPMPNARIHILDGNRQLVPVGVAGEIYIGGAGVARGYLNRPELTQERFVSDPFATEPGARMYRTGDLGRWDAEGRIEFLGRNDHQVKIRGYRIELGEIEAQLMRVPGVRQAAVIAREDSAGDKRIVAYVVCDAPVQLDAAELRAHLRTVLPEYMVPAAYVRLEQLPLTTNGKLNRSALPEPAAEAYAQRSHAAPVGEVEQSLAQIWSELLSVERVGRDDSFFELGGHSLLAVQLVSRIRRDFQVEMSIHEIFEHDSLRRMAAALITKQLALFSDEQVNEISQELDRYSAEELRALLTAE
jgi:amino acid adenylation domain-containing protein